MYSDTMQHYLPPASVCLLRRLLAHAFAWRIAWQVIQAKMLLPLGQEPPTRYNLIRQMSYSTCSIQLYAMCAG